MKKMMKKFSLKFKSYLRGYNHYFDEFEYDKISNILNAKGKVKIEDVVKNYIIYGNSITYEKFRKNFF